MSNMIKKAVKEILGPQNVINLQTKKRYSREPFLKDVLNLNKKFEGCCAGKRCFILGNGPSLNKVDFSLLADEYTFSVNQLPRNKDFALLKTNFHIWSDWRFFDLKKESKEDMELLDVMKKVNTGDNRPAVFYRYMAYDMVKEFGLDRELDIYYYEQVDPVDKLPKFVDFTKLIPGFYTVIHYAVCLAIYLGFSEIYLLGCDCSGFISTAEAKLGEAEKSLYGYSVSENEKKRMEKVAKQTSLRNELAWYVGLFDDYQMINDYCKFHGVELYNASATTLLETIRRIDLETVLNGRGTKDK